jgi:hypothetical protein
MASSNQVDYQVVPAEPASWPQLLSKTVDDLSKIVRTEIALAERTLQLVVESQTEKITGLLFLLVACAYGSLFLLGGVVLLLHLWLDWWLAFLITGALVMVAGLLLQLRMSALARAKSAANHARDGTRGVERHRSPGAGSAA